MAGKKNVEVPKKVINLKKWVAIVVRRNIIAARTRISRF